jgi:hypothetical protein
MAPAELNVGDKPHVSIANRKNGNPESNRGSEASKPGP